MIDNVGSSNRQKRCIFENSGHVIFNTATTAAIIEHDSILSPDKFKVYVYLYPE